MSDQKLDQYNHLCNNYKIITECWLCGPAEKDSNGNKFDGAYPAGFIRNWKNAFSKYIPQNPNVLHVCAGRISKTEGKTLDIDPKYEPDYLCNAETMIYGSLTDGQKEVPTNTFDWVLADPPYNKEAALKYYNKTLLKKGLMLRQMGRVVKPNGFVGVLDQTMPVSPPKTLKCVARIGITSVPNLDMRIFTVFRKVNE